MLLTANLYIVYFCIFGLGVPFDKARTGHYHSLNIITALFYMALTQKFVVVCKSTNRTAVAVLLDRLACLPAELRF